MIWMQVTIQMDVVSDFWMHIQISHRIQLPPLSLLLQILDQLPTVLIKLLSTMMLSTRNYLLNALSKDAAMTMIDILKFQAMPTFHRL